MIDLQKIKNIAITSQEQYDLINAALEAAEDNGFLNKFVFERALLCREALLLLPDWEEGDLDLVEKNPIQAFDKFLENGTIDILYNNFRLQLNYLAEVAANYYDDYEAYLRSLGSVINKASILSSETLGNISSSLKDVDLAQVLQIADEWGLNREENRPDFSLTDLSSKESDSLLNLV